MSRFFHRSIRCWLPVLLLAVLSACSGNNSDSIKSSMAWEGHWQRTLPVPGRQGRCIDEHLFIDRKQWQLRAIVHSTFECNQPFLEVLYDGVLETVAIKRNSDDRQMTFTVTDIHLAELVDVAGDDRAVLKGSAIKSLSGRYVPSNSQRFSQQVLIGKDNNSLRSNVYPPVLELSSAGAELAGRQFVFHRQQQGQ